MATKKSVTLTCINTFTPLFRDLVELKKQGKGDKKFLIEFIRNLHKNCTITEVEGDFLQVETKRNVYKYEIRETYIYRIDQDAKKRYWYISYR